MEEQAQTLPKDWIEVCIGDIAPYIQRGKSPKYIEKSALPVINQKCIRWYGVDTQHVKYIHPDQWNSLGGERYLRDDDILWNSTGTGTIGRACLYNTKYFAKAVVDSHVTIVRCHKNISSHYVFYFIASPYVQKKIEDMQTGSTNQVELGRVAINQTVLPLPPLNEQKRIVDKIEMLFSDLDKGEENLRTAQRLLSSYRQAVLKAAVTGELTRDWREANKHRLESGEELLKRILKSRREKWQSRGKYIEPTAPDTTNLPPLPNGWTWATLPQLGEFGRGKSKHRPRNDAKLYENGKYPFLQTGTVRNSKGRIRTYDNLYSDLGLRQSKLWPAGTVCITIAANIAESGILEIEACFPDSVVGLIPHPDISGEYVEFFIRTARSDLERYAPATAQKNINLEILGKVAFPLPPQEEQAIIFDKVEDIFSRISALETWCETELKRSNTLRQSILKSAFSGQLVPQDAADESASELLKRIIAERDATSKQKPAKRGRSGKQEAA